MSGSSSSSRYSSVGGYGSRAQYPSGMAYRAPSRTMSRISSSSPGQARPNYNRPQTRIPAASQSIPTKVTYTTNYYGSSYGRGGYSGSRMLLAGGAGLVGGYYLGRMMGGMSRPWGYSGYGYYGGGGYYGPSPYQTYVPYREQYSTYMTTTPSPLLPQVTNERYLVLDMNRMIWSPRCPVTVTFDAFTVTNFQFCRYRPHHSCRKCFFEISCSFI